MAAVVIAVLFATGLVATGTLAAQTVQGVITGVVTDVSGAVIPGSTVTITNQGTGIKQTAKTNGSGVYRFSLVPPGTYTVASTAPNFGTVENKDVVVQANQQISLNYTLRPASEATSVTVTEAAPLVQTATSDESQQITASQIQNQPLVDRNVEQLTFVAPQVEQGMNFGFAASGQREASTAYTLNGSDDNDNFGEGNSNVNPPLASVQDFTVLTNNMSAQYGRAAGAVVSMDQKSGTNSLHGSLYEFNRNRSLDANDFFSNRAQLPKTPYIRNQFGGSIGGPIIKDKTFFYFAYDQVTLHTIDTGAESFPEYTASELAAITPTAGPIAKSVLAATPIPAATANCPAESVNFPTAIGHVGCIFIPHPTVSDPQHNYYMRVDQQFGSNDRLYFAGTLNWLLYYDEFGGGQPIASSSGVTGIPYNDPEHYWNFSLDWTHTFSPTFVNEVAVAHNRHFSDFNAGTPAINAVPNLYFDNASYGFLSLQTGTYAGIAVEAFTQDRFQVTDNATVQAGNHSIKFGGGWQPGILYRNWDLGAPAFYEFANSGDPAYTGPGSAPKPAPGVINDTNDPCLSGYTCSNFQNDFPYFQQQSIDPRTGANANAYRHYMMQDSNLFVQDDWKATQRLTLNLGLRWDRYGAPTEAHNIIAQLTNFNCLTSNVVGPPLGPANSSYNCVANAITGPVSSMWNTRNGDFGPRIGFAYDVFGDGRTALRGAFGIAYDRIFDNVWSNGAWNPPFYGLIDADATAGDSIFYSNPATIGPAYTPLPNGQVNGHRVSIRTMENNLKDTSGQNWYLGIEHQFANNFLVRANYQGTQGRHEPVLMNYNRFDGCGARASLSCKRPNSHYTGFNYRANAVNSNYNSLDTEIQKRLSNGLQFQFSYVWSKLIDTNSDLFAGSTATASSQPYYYVSNAHLNLDRGLGAFDHTNSFKFNWTYELPFLKNQQGFIGHALGGWQFSGFFHNESGHPMDVYCGRGTFAGDANVPGSALPENLGCDYNLDGVHNDHPDFTGNKNSVYSSGSPADGVFTDVNPIGCGYAGQLSSAAATAACNANYGVTKPNSLFTNPSVTNGPIRFGTLGRNVFFAPPFNDLDAALMKNFKITESTTLQVRGDAANFLNHPNFDGVDTNLDSGSFGKAGFVNFQSGPRRVQLGATLTF
jgi:hypothetical protein